MPFGLVIYCLGHIIQAALHLLVSSTEIKVGKLQYLLLRWFLASVVMAGKRELMVL